MKTNYLPTILISLTLIVGINLWAIERDNKRYQVVCEEIKELEKKIYGRVLTCD